MENRKFETFSSSSLLLHSVGALHCQQFSQSRHGQPPDKNYRKKVPKNKFYTFAKLSTWTELIVFTQCQETLVDTNHIIVTGIHAFIHLIRIFCITLKFKNFFEIKILRYGKSNHYLATSDFSSPDIRGFRMKFFYRSKNQKKNPKSRRSGLIFIDYPKIPENSVRETFFRVWN